MPASVRHDAPKEQGGLARYSFFVYGGVNIQPKINFVKIDLPMSGKAVNRQEITRGFQNHHIISNTNAATKNHPLLQNAGFNNLNSRLNRIFLPTAESQHPSRSIHVGRHTQAAMDAVAERMRDTANRGKAENWNQAQYRAALRTLLSELRQELRAGNIALNKKHRPWAK